MLTNDPNQRPLFTIFNTVGSMLGMGVMQFLIPMIKNNYNILDEAGKVAVSGYARPELYRIITPIGIAVSVGLTILAIIGIAAKDRPEFYGLGGKQEKVKFSEYAEIIKHNKPMQRLMVAGAGCKLALAIATNTPWACAGCTPAASTLRCPSRAAKPLSKPAKLPRNTAP